jgi:hypothetical protein
VTYREACYRLYVQPGAPLAVAEAAYRVASKSAHPDAGGDVEEMRGLNEAMEVVRAQGEQTRYQGYSMPECEKQRPRFLDQRVGFGKHKDLSWGRLPLGYLAWLAEKSSYQDSRRKAIQALHIISASM